MKGVMKKNKKGKSHRKLISYQEKDDQELSARFQNLDDVCSTTRRH